MRKCKLSTANWLELMAVYSEQEAFCSKRTKILLRTDKITTKSSCFALKKAKKAQKQTYRHELSAGADKLSEAEQEVLFSWENLGQLERNDRETRVELSKPHRFLEETANTNF